MTLIKIKHYYEGGAGNNVGDVWKIVGDENKDWTEAECREYVQDMESETYVLDHNEASRPNYYMLEDGFPNWEDGGWYDYDNCESKDEDGAACEKGCDDCPYEASCFKLQKEQQIAWIIKNGKAL